MKSIEAPGTALEARSLSVVNEGSRVRLVEVEAERKFKAHLMAMGLIQGREIDVIRNYGQDLLVIACGDSRITLGRDVAEKVMVA